MQLRHVAPALALLALVACPAKKEPTPPAPTGTRVKFNLDAPNAPPDFFAFPWPSDLRLADGGTPDLRVFPNKSGSSLVKGLLRIAAERKAFPVAPTVYFEFDGPLSTTALTGDAGPHQATQDERVLLVDVEHTPQGQGLDEFGKALPVIVDLLEKDDYVPANLVAVSPAPGVVLKPRHHYAVLIRRDFGDATGAPLGVPDSLWALEHEETPAGPNGAAAQALYAPVWDALVAALVAPSDVAAATVFTTADVVADLEALSTALVTRDAVTVSGLTFPDGGVHQGFCEVNATVTFAQYQQGTPPFDSQGSFVNGADGLPASQGAYANVPVVLTFPSGAMPAAGYPLVQYFHGSGGVSRASIDRGTAVFDGGVWANTLGEGPAWVLAPYGFATAAAALPLNPERLPGAKETAYLNFANLAAFRDTFRQGVVEQRQLMKALQPLTVTLTPEQLAACTITLPAGATALKFDPAHLFAQGQSMGGMYTNLISAVEPRIQAAIPTGAGGFWQGFVLDSPQVPKDLIPPLLSAGAHMTWQHPTMALLELAWEPVDPMVYATRLGRRPLPGHPVRSIYEPVGKDDTYFSERTYDAMALAYGHRQAGAVVWPSLQAKLALQGKDGLLTPPVTDELTDELQGRAYTGVVLQWVDPTGYDGHALYSQVPEVKHQYACFLSTFLKTGHATLVAPAAVGAPCE
jgi:hypothetical protein